MPTEELNGIVFHYERTGYGIPVVLITGLMGETCFWDRALPLMEGCDVITVDNRGCGSTVCKGRFTVKDMADDIAALLDRIGVPKAHILGWSMGSHISICLAANHPDKVMSLTVASSYLKRPARANYILGLMSEWYFDGKMSEEAVGAFMNVLLRTEGFFEKAEMTNRPIRSMGLSNKEGMLLQLGAGNGYDPKEDCGKVSCPVLYMHGEEDIMVSPSEGRRLAEALGTENIVMFPENGHLLSPRCYVPAFLDFIRGV